MKKLSVYICLIMLALLVTSCSELVTPVAYTRYKTTGTQYAVYTADMVGNQIVVYTSEAELDEMYPSIDIEFSFYRCLGADDTLGDGKRYTLVDVTHSTANLTVYIYDDVYDENKRIRLNGQIILPDSDEFLDPLHVLTFDKFPLVRTNKHGIIDPEAVNVIEYY